MERWARSVAFVTGASAGIGKSIVEKLVEADIKVVGLARRKEKLDEIATNLSSKKGKFYPYVGDVSKEEDLLSAFKWTKQHVGPVSLLINNAGVAPITSATEFSTKDWASALNINVLATAIATREALKQMKENNIDGHIININSVAGHRVSENLPGGHVYQASKHALKAITESLRFELIRNRSKVRVTGIHPGTVKTDMYYISKEKFNNANHKGLNIPTLESDDVVQAILYALSVPQRVQINELTIQALF
ncbi:unnamed protein product [Phyllotreta striolata]|uniref:Farnesol dehydrogenase-like n=1 Tax=Phyllotreta striolata TaxID=444603 RepID=A0A9N9TFL3_PHYSR|nr:unnamed protein product [Phyllotreta striolata]